MTIARARGPGVSQFHKVCRTTGPVRKSLEVIDLKGLEIVFSQSLIAAKDEPPEATIRSAAKAAMIEPPETEEIVVI